MSSDREPRVWLPAIRAGTGADVFTTRLCAGLNARGIRTEITWLPPRSEYLPWTIPLPHTPDWANVAHVNSWLPWRFWPEGIPTVVTVHHLVHDPAFRPFRSKRQAAYHELVIRPRELRAIRDADAVTTVSRYVAGTVREFSGRDDVRAIHNWVDSDVYAPSEIAPRDPPGSFRLFMAGSSSLRKGFDLLPAFVDTLGPGFELRYAGGRAEVALPNVTCLGRIGQSELIREFQRCDAVVSLSRYEGFGYTALEAMACGKPFIGFAGSGLGEVVEDRRTALMAKGGDVVELAAHCRRLHGDPELAAALGSAGRKRAEERFSSAGALDAYRDIYSGLVAIDRRSRR